MTKKKIIITIAIILAVAVIAVCVTVPTLYMNGLIGSIHKLNSPKDGQVRVACVGDSLTYGYGVSNWVKNNYPAQLGKLLGDEYCVNNYGYSGRTASKTGDRPYVSEKLYRQSLSFSPNIVIIMLGSNDTKSGNWKGKDAYVDDYKEIIESYLALESVESMIIMSPTPVWLKNGKRPYGINIDLVATDVRLTARELAEEYGLGYIDLYEIFEDKSDLFKDGAHPSAAGARMIATAVSEYMTHTRYEV
ncbi:MAG: GDSL-type esterase/lipase family protein [Bacteroides sp.]|nr:GDSL-type esterase/lipase family protein [Bacillota bacterium]MCM1455307.1 GDSL-type esterase/lipase family protein [Bacteroides sp.]